MQQRTNFTFLLTRKWIKAQNKIKQTFLSIDETFDSGAISNADPLTSAYTHASYFLLSQTKAAQVSVQLLVCQVTRTSSHLRQV